MYLSRTIISARQEVAIMGNIIRSDLYRLRKSKVFWACLGVTFALAVGWVFMSVGLSLWGSILSPDTVKFTTKVDYSLASLISEPVGGMVLPVIMLLSMVSFCYADLSNGYIKNIAGHVKKRSHTAISKFLVMAVLTLIFMVVSVLGAILGSYLQMLTGGGTFDFTSKIGSAVLVFILKYLLYMALASILLFLSTGLRSKTLASVIGVLFGSGLLSLLYSSLGGLIHFDLDKYMPDSLSGQLQYATIGTLVVNALLVSIGFIIVFTVLTCQIMDKRDVK